MIFERAHLLAYQQSTAQRAQTHQTHFAIGKVDYLQGAGVVDQPFDVFGDQLLGVDPSVDRNGPFGEQLVARGVLAGTDPRDARRRTIERVRDLAGDHVHFVTAGQCHQDVGVDNACGLEHRRIRRTAGHRAHVEAILQFAQHVFVGVDDGDFVGGLAREVISRSAAHLSGAQNQHFHRIISRLA